MIFTKPAEWEPAIKKMAGRSPIGAMLSTADWQNLPVALRDRAFFSARIENAQFLQQAKDMIDSFLRQETEVLPNGEVALKVDGRARFIAKMQELAIAQGMGPSGLGPIQDKSVLDVRSNTRLGLIFDTQTRQAYHYGNFKAGLSDHILMVYPAQRFVRHPGAKIKRPLHEANENVVKLKSDTAFWLRMNDPEIGGFGVPWGPWGFNSYMDVRDVTRGQAEELGLLKEDSPAPKVRDVDFNEQLRASVTNLDPGIESVLRQVFGKNVVFRGGEVYWRGQKPFPPPPKPPPPVVPPPVIPPIPPPVPPTPPVVPLPAPTRVKPAAKPKEPPPGAVGPPPALPDGASVRAELLKIKRIDVTQTPEYLENRRKYKELGDLRDSREGVASTIAGRTKLTDERIALNKEYDALLAREKARYEALVSKALEIPASMRGSTSIMNGGDVWHESKRQPTAANWKKVGEITDLAAKWIDRHVPKAELKPVIFNYYDDRNFAFGSHHKVYLNEDTGIETAVHEIAHILEQKNSGWLQAAKDFRARRTMHEAPVQLAKYYPKVAYKPEEKALRDKWEERGAPTIYCGKIYPTEHATEIVTMGMQWLNERPIEFATSDPDYFDFIVNLIRGLPQKPVI
jgi:hypothetical protein